ncbi:hypothetical protein MKW98_022726 [Papaver atlanticum]|uniref:Cation-transporting P-type ATPase N-terminal domain-containing protein n=1 Tax=Papaver atlanticum TaxID=357466 RepID=A0AAD4T3E5_9MAGN|nr:hypothetical protein MKW98_004805 [Papaver atlanticum]KAI3934448.1 hypothetical protein MKW98_022726 [Papaver atlanticum]
MDELFKHLECTEEDLTTEIGTKRLQIYGPNKLEEKKESKILKFLGFMWNLLLWVMELDAVIVISGPPIFGERSRLARLRRDSLVLGDVQWSVQDPSILIPRYIKSIKLGNIFPTDARLLQGDLLKIDHSSSSGECCPVAKNPSKEVFSVFVIATQLRTFFGKETHLVDNAKQVGNFQKVISSDCSHRTYMHVYSEVIIIDDVIVLLIGGIPIAMPTVVSVTMVVGFSKLSKKGVITKRMTIIEELAGMNILCFDKTRTLIVTELTADNILVEVFKKDVSKEDVILMDARASRIANNNVIDACMVGMLVDPKETIRNALTYAEAGDSWHRANKGTLELVNSFNVPKKTKESREVLWEFVSMMPLFDPSRIDSAKPLVGPSTLVRSAYDCQGKRDEARKGNKYVSICLVAWPRESIPINKLIEEADVFAGVFPETKFQESKHIVGMTEHGVDDAPALKRIYAISITIRIVFGFMLITLIWKFDFSPFMVLVIDILNDGTITTISKDKVKPSTLLNNWKLKKHFCNWYSTWYITILTLIFITRSRSYSYSERFRLFLAFAFPVAQLIFSIVIYIPLDILKFLTQYTILLEKTGFATKKDFGTQKRQAQCVHNQRTNRGLQLSSYFCSIMLFCWLRTMHALKGHVKSVTKLKCLDVNDLCNI